MNTSTLGKLFLKKFSFALPTSEAPVIYQKYYFFCQGCAQHRPRSELIAMTVPNSRTHYLCSTCSTHRQALAN